MQPHYALTRPTVIRCLWLGITLCLAVFINACGGGGGGTPSVDSMAPTNVPPVASGAILISSESNLAEVGKRFITKLNVSPIDAKNSITGLTISNTTVGGATPSLTADGTLDWNPNANDVNTQELRIIATDATRVATELVLQVRVYQANTIFEVALVPDIAVYSDPDGAYVVKVETLDGSPLSGTIKVSESRHRDGGRSLAVTTSSPNVIAALTAHPKGNAAVAGLLTTQAVAKTMSPGMKYQDGLTPGIGMGSVNRYGINLYTTREEVYFWNPAAHSAKPGFGLWEQTKVMQVDSTCISKNECNKLGAPVILIHGFNPELFTIGGGEGTWGTLVNHLRYLSSVG
jgi:hypothetical protein